MADLTFGVSFQRAGRHPIVGWGDLMRLQLALNVRDIDEAVGYYSKLFDAEPNKRREGYANFAIEEPPLKLVLFENQDAPERLNHLGVEVFGDIQVRSAAESWAKAGILQRVERQETCCHATQDKAWSEDPQGLRWEVYRIIDDQPVAPGRAGEGETSESLCRAADCCI